MDESIPDLIRVEVSASSDIGGSVVSRELLSSTRFLKFYSLSYKLAADRPGAKSRGWDSVSRTTRKGEADAVVVVALIRTSDDPRILLVKQFRPPLNKIVVEFPAGLIDADERPTDAALRELREETGFSGRVISVSKPRPLSPGISDEMIVQVTVDIEEQGRQSLEESERIEVISVPLRRLGDCLEHLEEKEDCFVMNSVGCVAAGLELSASIRSS